MRILATTVLAVLLHLLLGWMWVVVAAFAGGLMTGRGGWLVGLAGTGLAWLALVIYSFAIASDETSRMLGTLGVLMGGIPGVAVIGATLVVALILGTLGGLVGTRAGYALKLYR